MNKRYFVNNDWTGKCYLVNDRKSAVKLGNKMIEDWKVELCGENYHPDDYDFEYSVCNFRTGNYKCVGLNEWKYEINITLIPMSEVEIVK